MMAARILAAPAHAVRRTRKKTVPMKCLTAALGLILLVGGGSPGVLAAELGGFFSCAEIVFFGPCSKTAPAAAQPPRSEGVHTAEPAQDAVPRAPSAKPSRAEESVWAEPVRGPDGQLRVYLSPKPVRDFLEKPTPENARAYLEWNQARMRQMDEAVNVMREVAAQRFGITAEEPAIVSALPSAPGAPARRETAQLLPPTPPPPAPKTIEVPAPAPGETATGPISIIYAFATWCPYSRRQTPIINQLAAHVPVRGIAFDSTPEEVQALRPALAFPVMHGDVDLRERLGVRSYPTIFFYEGSRLLHVARGLQSPDRLVTALAALTSRQSPPALGAGREPGGDTCRLRT
jgi:thiol-disulfide isomerase/thioredoxin